MNTKELKTSLVNFLKNPKLEAERLTSTNTSWLLLLSLLFGIYFFGFVLEELSYGIYDGVEYLFLFGAEIIGIAFIWVALAVLVTYVGFLFAKKVFNAKSSFLSTMRINVWVTVLFAPIYTLLLFPGMYILTANGEFSAVGMVASVYVAILTVAYLILCIVYLFKGLKAIWNIGYVKIFLATVLSGILFAAIVIAWSLVTLGEEISEEEFLRIADSLEEVLEDE